jgi:hypothetical protein
MSTIAVRNRALPSIEKARVLLTECRKVQDVLRIKALAQAVASCEASENARDEASAIVLLAKARIGELTAAIEKSRTVGAGRGKGVTRVPSGNKSKTEQLEAEGISRKEAAECERIAALKRTGTGGRSRTSRPVDSRRSSTIARSTRSGSRSSGS